jgi:Periplasmic protein involved in polysaccharide export
MTRQMRSMAIMAAALALFAAPRLAAQSVQIGSAGLPSARLAPGDDVVVVVFQEKELSARVYVDDRSQITLPRLGAFDVSHMTSEMLRDTIRARYATFLREPSVDVRALRRVTVNGAVFRPDVYYLDPSMTLRDVIARAGGVSSEGNSHKVSIVRGAESMPYPNWSGTAQGLTELRSGDEVVVGRRNWAALNAGSILGAAGVLATLAIAFLR